MKNDLATLASKLRKTAVFYAEDANLPLQDVYLIGNAGDVIEHLRLALEAALDQTIVEPTDEVADLKTRLETINKIIRDAVNLAA